MNRRVLVVEPDRAGRGVLDILLTNEGYLPELVGSIRERGCPVDPSAFDFALIDAHAGSGSASWAALEEVRWVRRNYPALPVIVMAAMVTPQLLMEALRLRVVDVLPKPFTPDEVRASLARISAELVPRHAESLEFAAAIEVAVRSLGEGDASAAVRALARARAQDGFDAETMALRAFAAELEGDDEAAGRGYRAAVALRESEDVIVPDPYESLARIETYGDARPVIALDRAWVGGDVIIASRARGAEQTRPARPERFTTVYALGLATDPGTVYFREGSRRAFMLFSGPLGVAKLTPHLRRLSPRTIAADPGAIDAAELRRLQAAILEAPSAVI